MLSNLDGVVTVPAASVRVEPLFPRARLAAPQTRGIAYVPGVKIVLTITAHSIAGL